MAFCTFFLTSKYNKVGICIISSKKWWCLRLSPFSHASMFFKGWRSILESGENNKNINFWSLSRIITPKETKFVDCLLVLHLFIATIADDNSSLLIPLPSNLKKQWSMSLLKSVLRIQVNVEKGPVQSTQISRAPLRSSICKSTKYYPEGHPPWKSVDAKWYPCVKAKR